MAVDVDTAVVLVFLAGERRLFRQGLGRMLAHGSDFELVGDSPDVDPDDERLQQADVLVVSDAARHAAALQRLAGDGGPPILILSEGRSPVGARVAFKIGYRGYIGKDATPEAFMNAVRTVASGGSYVDPSAGPSGPSAAGDLTPREFVKFK